MTTIEVFTPDQCAPQRERSPYVLATAGMSVDSDENRGESMRVWASGLL